MGAAAAATHFVTVPHGVHQGAPSATAVLPTPGSPMRTGLFLVRRDRIWMARRISSSRPMTGSSFPSRAAAVRSRAYLASASYLPSGSCLGSHGHRRQDNNPMRGRGQVRQVSGQS